MTQVLHAPDRGVMTAVIRAPDTVTLSRPELAVDAVQAEGRFRALAASARELQELDCGTDR